MLITFGSSVAHIQMGDAGARPCPICRDSTQHSFVLTYQYFYLLDVLGAVTSRRYACMCHRCRNGVAVQRKDLPMGHIQSDPIPFMHRYGLVVGPLIGLIGAILLCFILLEFVIK
jgi:hypothetical protein